MNMELLTGEEVTINNQNVELIFYDGINTAEDWTAWPA